jgi:hypothetical protein
VHCVCNPKLNLTPWHQSSTISPQNGSSTVGFAVIFFTFFAVFPLSRFLDAFERDDTTATLSKSNSSFASNNEHVSTPSENSFSITPTANSTEAERIPRSTAADIVILDIFVYNNLILCFISITY